MKYTIEKDGLNAVVSSLGSELQSLRYKDIEYLWQAGPVWPKHAPLLFPIVGRLKDGRYTYEGKEYELGGHGFARSMEFELAKKTPDEVILLLSSSNETRAVYPFDFELLVSHRIEQGLLVVTYTVRNQSDRNMLFSIGAHEGYSCELEPDDRFEDYRLVFSEQETIGREEIIPPLIGTKTLPLFNQENMLPLSYQDYAVDAIVLVNQKSKSVRLESTRHGKGVEVTFAGWPFLGIWTKPGAPYLCIEPWYGIGDRTNATGKLEEKEGIQRLAASTTFECVHTIRCF